MVRPSLQGIAIGVLAWTALVLLFLLATWTWPRTATEWLLAFGLGPVVYMLIEVFGEALAAVVRRLRPIRALESGMPPPTDRRFSWRRVLLGTMQMLVMVAVIGLFVLTFVRLFGDPFSAIQGFASRHFH